MSHTPRNNDFTIASGATGSNNQYVGNATRIYLHVGDDSSWNAGTGNVAYALYGSYASGVSAVPIPGATITTAGSGIFPLNGAAGVPFLEVHVGTATTADATINLIIANDE